MLKFDEQERPSFVELAKLVLTSTENSLDSETNAAAAGGRKPPGGLAGKRMSGAAKAMGTGAAAANKASIEL